MFLLLVVISFFACLLFKSVILCCNSCGWVVIILS